MLDNQCGQLLQFPGESAVAVELLSALARQENTLAQKSATIIMGKSWKTEVRRGLSEELSLPDIFYISTLPGKYLGTQTHLNVKDFLACPLQYWLHHHLNLNHSSCSGKNWIETFERFFYFFFSKQLSNPLDIMKYLENWGAHNLSSVHKYFHLLFLTVPGGVETRYSCCENAVGSPGCQVFKVHYSWSQTLHLQSIWNALYT